MPQGGVQPEGFGEFDQSVPVQQVGDVVYIGIFLQRHLHHHGGILRQLSVLEALRLQIVVHGENVVRHENDKDRQRHAEDRHKGEIPAVFTMPEMVPPRVSLRLLLFFSPWSRFNSSVRCSFPVGSAPEEGVSFSFFFASGVPLSLSRLFSPASRREPGSLICFTWESPPFGSFKKLFVRGSAQSSEEAFHPA